MSLIPREYLNAVVAIGIDNTINDKTGKSWIATGFLVSMQEPNVPTVTTYYLVTNKHVFEHKKQVYIRFNSTFGEFIRDYRVDLIDKYGQKLYTDHPRNNVDIAVMQINPYQLINDNAIWNAFDLYANSLDLNMMKMTGVDEGSIVYSLGFPMNLVDTYKTPICRYGCISRISDVFLNPQDISSYLVDVHSFPGNSGGPIINKPENISLPGTNCNPLANLVGILSANIQYEDALISQQTNKIRMVQSENSGLTIVYPVDRIREVALLDWNRHRINIGNMQNINDSEYANISNEGNEKGNTMD